MSKVIRRKDIVSYFIGADEEAGSIKIQYWLFASRDSWIGIPFLGFSHVLYLFSGEDELQSRIDALLRVMSVLSFYKVQEIDLQ